MKTKLLSFFLLTMLLQVSINAFAMGLDTRQNIKLKSKEIQHSHRSMPIFPIAFINGSLLSVDFLSAVTSATITVRDAETDEIVYSSTDLNVTTLQIDLTGECIGKYMLEIQITTTIFSGEFEL